VLGMIPMFCEAAAGSAHRGIPGSHTEAVMPLMAVTTTGFVLLGPVFDSEAA